MKIDVFQNAEMMSLYSLNHVWFLPWWMSDILLWQNAISLAGSFMPGSQCSYMRLSLLVVVYKSWSAEDGLACLFIIICKSGVCKNKYTERNLYAHTNAVVTLQNKEITSPALSSSSSELPAQGVWALKAPSMFSRNSWTDALSFSGSGALFENVTIKL